MKSFIKWLHEAITTAAPPNIGSPPDNAWDGDNSGDEHFWKQGMEDSLLKWINNGSQCYKKVISTVTNKLLNEDENYEPDKVDYFQSVVNISGGVSIVQCSWFLKLDSIDFNMCEMAIKNILRANCDLWKYLKDIGYDNAWKATESSYFMQMFFYSLIMNRPTTEHLQNQVKYAEFNIAKNYRNQMANEFIKKYNQIYPKESMTVNDFKIRPLTINGFASLIGPRLIHQKTLEAFSDTRFTFDLIK